MPMSTGLIRLPRNLKIAGLVAGLVILLAAAIGFTVAAVQVQAGVAAYIGGQSTWSRAQLASVHYLGAYAQTGRTPDLEQARQWLDILLGDMEGRNAMEAAELDRERVHDALIRGRNHPDDIPRLIWLYRNFSDLDAFRQAVDVWKASDPYVLALDRIADRLEAEWNSTEPDRETLRNLVAQLSATNDGATVLTEQFLASMTRASRQVTRLLSWVSVGFLIGIGLLAWFLCWNVMRIQRGSERKFRAIFEQAAVGMAQVDHSGRIVDLNPAICQTLKYPREQLLGMRYRDLVLPEDWPLGQQQVRNLSDGKLENYTLEQRFRAGDGGTVWVRITVSLVRATTTDLPYYVVILEDVSESRRLSVELSYQATHDTLTGLYNRRAFERRLVESLRLARLEHSQHALCLVDIDQFKVINDTSGHSAGDRLLRQIVVLLRKNLREGDMLARLGGDEFGVILENCDLETAAQVMNKLREAVMETDFSWQGRRFTVSCSIGVVPISTSTPNIESLLRVADIACNLAKERGRNRVYLSSENDEQLAEQYGQMEWLNRIRSALHDNRMLLDAQYIAPTRPGSHGLRYEVLVRLRGEDGTVFPPGDFLPAAERFGAVQQIDRWVIEETLRLLSAHPQHLKALEACHINLSGRSFDQPDFHDFVVEALDRYRVPPEKICFEITETAAVNSLTDAIAFMERLGERGCTFALDDFGTGLSSFSYLRQLPVSFLKIDGVFVRDIARDKIDLAMVRAINEIGQTLNKKTIAEFVENDDSLALLDGMGVNSVQGFGIHRPCRFADVLSGQAMTPGARQTDKDR